MSEGEIRDVLMERLNSMSDLFNADSYTISVMASMNKTSYALDMTFNDNSLNTFDAVCDEVIKLKELLKSYGVYIRTLEFQPEIKCLYFSLEL